MRLLMLAPIALLTACGGAADEADAPEDTPQIEEIETPRARDITAIDAATDYDAGLADEDVPGLDEPAEEEE